MHLRCQNCGNQWDYRGNNVVRASCSDCRASVSIAQQAENWDDDEREAWEFHRWMREKHADLSSGHRLDIVQAVRGVVVDGYEWDEFKIGSAAWKKHEAFREQAEPEQLRKSEDMNGEN